MESRLDMTNFEQTLREHADQFSMMPSKRVWNGVYNSLHPGSKWPSGSMLLFFILALVGIGPLNNAPANQVRSLSTDHSGLSMEEDEKQPLIGIRDILLADETAPGAVRNTEPAKVVPFQTPLQKTILPTPVSSRTLLTNKKVPEKNLASEENASQSSLVRDESFNAALATPPSGIQGIISDGKEAGVPSTRLQSKVLSQQLLPELGYSRDDINFKGETSNIQIDSRILSFGTSAAGSVSVPKKESSAVEGDTEAVRDGDEIAALPKKGSKKATWIFYVTPSISSVYFRGSPLENKNPQHSNPSPLVINVNQLGNPMRFNARASLNMGTEMNYPVADKWKLVTGLQVSYSGYNILSHKVHPSFAELVLRDGAESTRTKRYITYYGNGEGQDEITLHNNSFQVSVPVGTKYRVWENNKIEIDVFAGAEPVFVIHSEAFILSADSRNYVNDPELLRQANVTGQLGSVISFAGEKVKWHVGPMIRYQVLSSYKNLYPINEHLLDYGIKIGISK